MRPKDVTRAQSSSSYEENLVITMKHAKIKHTKMEEPLSKQLPANVYGCPVVVVEKLKK
jgi:hypothetical protein